MDGGLSEEPSGGIYMISPDDLPPAGEALAREEAERLAAEIDWERVRRRLRPTQSWFDDTDNPFEPEERE
jgi:hypothetical protein